MQPLGRKPSRFPGKTDHHLKRFGLMNWWEDEMSVAKKKSARQESKKEIKISIDMMYE